MMAGATDRWRKIRALNLPPAQEAHAIRVAQRLTRQLIAARLKMRRQRGQ
jgi:hypothetical protein